MADPFLGEIKMFGGWWTIKNYALCEGQILGVYQHEALFKLIDNMYGGDGCRTYKLPDLRGRVGIHCGTGVGLSHYNQAEQGGAEFVPLSGDHVPNHSHTMKVANADPTSDEPGGGRSLGKAALYANSAWDKDMNVGSIESHHAEGHYNVQPSLVIKYLIALTGTVPPRG